MRVPGLVANLTVDGHRTAADNTTLHPVLLLKASTGKMTSVPGASVRLMDVNPPAASDDFAVSQMPGAFAFAPTAGTLTENTGGHLDARLYLCADAVVPADAAEAILTAVSAPALQQQPGAVGWLSLTAYQAGTPLALASASNAAVLTVTKYLAAPGQWLPVDAASPALTPVLVTKDNGGLIGIRKLAPRPPAERTPPAAPPGALSASSSAATVRVSGLSSVVDSGSGLVSLRILLYTGAAALQAGAPPVSGAALSTIATPGASESSISGLPDLTLYRAWVLAVDALGNSAMLDAGSATTPDQTAPVFSGGMAVLQGATDYTFAVTSSDCGVADAGAGPLRAFLVMASASLELAQLAAVGVPRLEAGLDVAAKLYSANYAAGSTASLGSLVTTKYYDLAADTFAAIDSVPPGSPFQLYPHLVAVDAAGNVARRQGSPIFVTPRDRTSRSISGEGADMAVLQSDDAEYRFALTGEVALYDARSGTASAYLLLSDAPQTADALKGLVTGSEAASLDPASVRRFESYVGGTTVALGTIGSDGLMTSGQYLRTLAPPYGLHPVTDADAAAALYPHLLILDPAGDPTRCMGGLFAVQDRTPPALTGELALQQGAGSYEFATAAGAVSLTERRSGALEAALVMSSGGPLQDSTLAALFAAGAHVSKLTGIANPEPGQPFALQQLSTGPNARYYDPLAASWRAVSDRASSSPLWGNLVVADADGNVSVAATPQPLDVADASPPVIGGVLVVAQNAGTYSFSGTGVTVAEGRSAAVEVGMLLMSGDEHTALSDATAAALFAAGTHLAKATVSNPAPGAPAPVPALTPPAFYYDVGTTDSAGGWAPVSEASTSTALHGVLLAYDAAGNRATLASAAVPVADRTAPVLAQISAAATDDFGVVRISWPLVTDAGDSAKGAATAVHIGAYSHEQPSMSVTALITGSTTDGGAFVAKVVVADGKAAAEYDLGSGALGEAPLPARAALHYYALARDSAGNTSAPRHATVQ